MMKRTLTILALVALVALVVAPGVEAGLLDKLNKKNDDQKKKPQRYDLYPSMGFYTGTLGRDIGTGWTLGHYRLILAKDCSISSEVHDKPVLDEGRPALVMGPRIGDTIVAWRVRIQADEYGRLNENPEVEFTPSEVDPTVGEGTGPE